MDTSDPEHIVSNNQPHLCFTHFIFIPVTFVVCLIFGIFMVWMPSLNPWLSYLSMLSEELLQLASIRARYDVSVAFCGACGDRYLLTLELFLLIGLAYVALFCFIFFRRVAQWSKNVPERKHPEESQKRQLAKVCVVLIAACAVSGAMIWSLLFSVSFARPRGSNSDYSLYNYGLLLQVNILFHFLMLILAAAVEILAASTRIKLLNRIAP